MSTDAFFRDNTTHIKGLLGRDREMHNNKSTHIKGLHGQDRVMHNDKSTLECAVDGAPSQIPTLKF